MELEVILQAICKESRLLDGVNVATILYSAAKFPSLLTSSVLQYLIRTLRHEKLTLNGRAVGNALYGLQALRDSDQVRELLAALTPKVAQCTESKLNAQGIAQGLYGLRNLPDSPEMRGLLTAVTPLVQECTEPLTGVAVGNALSAR